MNSKKLILNHFYSADDLKHGIDVLQHFQVPILEVHVSKPVKGIDEKLQIKKLRKGHAAVKFGFFGGTALSTLCYYLIENGWPLMTLRSAYAFIISIIVMVVTFSFAASLFPGRAPKIIDLPKSGGQLYLIVVDAQSVSNQEEIRQLFQYAEAVEMSPLIKEIVTT